jgi:hypothetical protein
VADFATSANRWVLSDGVCNTNSKFFISRILYILKFYDYPILANKKPQGDAVSVSGFSQRFNEQVSHAKC